MRNASLAMAWLQLLALLAAEVGLIVLGVALLRRWSPTAARRRTVCQAGVTAVLFGTVCEVSGSARVLGSWAASALAWRHNDILPQRAEVPSLAPVTPVNLSPTVRSKSEAPVVGQTSRSAGDEASPPRLPTRSKQPFPNKPAVTVSRSPETVSDSMGVLWLCLVWVAGAAGA